jgi:hypothetical protein
MREPGRRIRQSDYQPYGGELVESGNEYALVAAPAEVARRSRTIAANRSEAICQQYSTSRMIKDIETPYQEVLNSGRSRRNAMAECRGSQETC